MGVEDVRGKVNRRRLLMGKDQWMQMELAYAAYSARRGRYDTERWNSQLGKALWHYLLISGIHTIQ